MYNACALLSYDNKHSYQICQIHNNTAEILAVSVLNFQNELFTPPALFVVNRQQTCCLIN